MKKRTSTFEGNRYLKELYYIPPRDIINMKRSSFYKIKYEKRVFHRNMFQGLCLGEFYGRQKIIFKRKDYFNSKKRTGILSVK